MNIYLSIIKDIFLIILLQYPPPFFFFAIGTERFANSCLMNYTKIKTLGRLRYTID